MNQNRCGRFDHQHRAWLQAVDVERADDHGGDRVPGDAQREHGHVGTAHRGVVGRFGRHKAFVGTLAKWARRVLDGALGVVVGHESRDVATRAGQSAHHHADARGARGQRQMFAHQTQDGMILVTFCLMALSFSSCICAITSATPKKPIMAAT
jgi:hypothetical protein